MKAKIFDKLSNVFLVITIAALVALFIDAIIGTVILCMSLCSSNDYTQLTAQLNTYFGYCILVFFFSGLLMLVTHRKHKKEIKNH